MFIYAPFHAPSTKQITIQKINWLEAACSCKVMMQGVVWKIIFAMFADLFLSFIILVQIRVLLTHLRPTLTHIVNRHAVQIIWLVYKWKEHCSQMSLEFWTITHQYKINSLIWLFKFIQAIKYCRLVCKFKEIQIWPLWLSCAWLESRNNWQQFSFASVKGYLCSEFHIYAIVSAVQLKKVSFYNFSQRNTGCNINL